MTLQEIKDAVNAGRKVCWHHEGYEVRKSKDGSFYVICLFNQHTIGLTWRDGVTLNGKPEDFKELPV